MVCWTSTSVTESISFWFSSLSFKFHGTMIKSHKKNKNSKPVIKLYPIHKPILPPIEPEMERWESHRTNKKRDTSTLTEITSSEKIAKNLTDAKFSKIHLSHNLRHRKKITKSYGWIRGEKLQSFTNLLWNFSFSPWIIEKLQLFTANSPITFCDSFLWDLTKTDIREFCLLNNIHFV